MSFSKDLVSGAVTLPTYKLGRFSQYELDKPRPFDCESCSLLVCDGQLKHQYINFKKRDVVYRIVPKLSFGHYWHPR